MPKERKDSKPPQKTKKAKVSPRALTPTNQPSPKPPPSSSASLSTPSVPDDQSAVEILSTCHSVEVIGNPHEVIQVLPAPPFPPAPVLQVQNESDPEWPVQAESEEEDADEEEELSSESQAACGKRKRPLSLPAEVERELGEWLQENTFLYDRGLTDYKNAVKKTRVLKEKASSLNPPLSAADLRRWIHSMRTRYGRLTKDKSGSDVPKKPSERDQWILQLFGFLGKHIVRQKATKTLGTKQSADLAALPPPPPPTQLGSSAHDVSDSDVEMSAVSSLQEAQFRGRARAKRRRTAVPTTHPIENHIVEKLLERHDSASRALHERLSTKDEEIAFWKPLFESMPVQMRAVNKDLVRLFNIELLLLVEKYVAMTKQQAEQGELDVSKVPADVLAAYRRVTNTSKHDLPL